MTLCSSLLRGRPTSLQTGVQLQVQGLEVEWVIVSVDELMPLSYDSQFIRPRD